MLRGAFGGGRRAEAMRGALALAAALLLLQGGRCQRPAEEAADDDGDGDYAPFTILVEHGDGWRCLGSMVSLRTALTSAWCARGRGARAAPELWARPAHASRRVRRVARVAFVASSEAAAATATADDDPDDGAGDPWRGAADDLAVLELEAPFGEEARARPILMATHEDECSPQSACHAVHAARRRGAGVALRIVDVALVEGEQCAARAPRWPSLRPSALCLAGATLCAGDWGAGVVCGGKLCAVVSRSAGAARDARRCGDAHVAQALPRWRRFLHCAHTLRLCGSDGECAHQCVEKQLAQERGAEVQAGATTAAVATPSGAPARDRGPTPHRTPLSVQNPTSVSKESTIEPTKTRTATRSAAPTAMAPTATAPEEAPPAASVVLPSLEFEPNRPDFKAGEYGDNGSEYGGEEPPGGGAPTRTPVPRRTPPARSPARAPPLAQLAAAASDELRPPASRSTPRSSLELSCAIFVYLYLCPT